MARDWSVNMPKVKQVYLRDTVSMQQFGARVSFLDVVSDPDLVELDADEIARVLRIRRKNGERSCVPFENVARYIEFDEAEEKPARRRA